MIDPRHVFDLGLDLRDVDIPSRLPARPVRPAVGRIQEGAELLQDVRAHAVGLLRAPGNDFGHHLDLHEAGAGHLDLVGVFGCDVGHAIADVALGSGQIDQPARFQVLADLSQEGRHRNGPAIRIAQRMGRRRDDNHRDPAGFAVRHPLWKRADSRRGGRR